MTLSIVGWSGGVVLLTSVVIQSVFSVSVDIVVTSSIIVVMTEVPHSSFVKISPEIPEFTCFSAESLVASTSFMVVTVTVPVVDSAIDCILSTDCDITVA